MRSTLTEEVVWQRVAALVDRAPTPADAAAHRLGAIGAWRHAQQDRPVPPEMAEEERVGLLAEVVVPQVLARTAALLPEPAVVLKGPVLARRYQQPCHRAYMDVDLVVGDAARGQAALLAGGAQHALEESAPADGHHERELVFPGLPIAIELHTFPSWPRNGRPPRADELLARAAADDELPAGMLVLPPAEHAVIVAGHSWGHRPLRRLRDLLDVALLLVDADLDAADAAAERWGVSRLWATTVDAVDALFGAKAAPLPTALRTWARDLPRARRRTLAETSLEIAIAPWWATTPATAWRDGVHGVRRAVRRRLS